MNNPQLQLVLEAKSLSRSYAQGNLKVDVLEDISFSVRSGERVAIVGSSGSGKSTLLHLLGGLDTPSSGHVMLAEQNLSTMNSAQRGKMRNQQVGFVYQFHHLLPEFSALENVSMPLLIGGSSKQNAAKAAAKLLERVGLGDRLEHKPAELSGGERQRAAIARALVNQPRIVLADEPTGNLDESTADKVYALMLELNQELGTSFLVVTHDSKFAGKMDRILRLSQGQISEEG